MLLSEYFALKIHKGNVSRGNRVECKSESIN